MLNFNFFLRNIFAMPIIVTFYVFIFHKKMSESFSSGRYTFKGY